MKSILKICMYVIMYHIYFFILNVCIYNIKRVCICIYLKKLVLKYFIVKCTFSVVVVFDWFISVCLLLLFMLIHYKIIRK